ncbi:cAMP-binding domain of CRP or a regulatory subunit of cAMP-dependent protein kinases [Sphingomonas sp. YR710]|jgi:CRP-like cAMP-binding protein|uniref:Crp/Fnr family transcriptional regulator n=1 Tax=Sphingomonas sp. YR710 TaxID=1882773 RepID=UPI0008859C14|nr:Crp/Fnr family transcriptional regulator [Sphingomonas sp. YR710]SDB98516.1 cAMP-binding domain of CRP or a regulatory subunit of cAMP-dependent protein kinases [Sphingomonas sp. YR710]
MSVADFAALEPRLVRVELARSQALIFPGQPIGHCWFLEEGIASMVITSSEGHETEAAIIGREGMVDAATILGVDASPIRSVIQIPGYGYRLPAPVLSSRLEASADLRSMLNRYVYGLLEQTANTALANASFTVEERLCRWLLMCSDRVDGAEICLTHELLSVMLNVRRAGVTHAVNSLEAAGMVKTRRGAILITDRPAVMRRIHGSYVPLSSADPFPGPLQAK